MDRADMVWCFLIFFRVTVEVPYNVTWRMVAGIWQASLHLDLDAPKLDIQMSSPDSHIMWIGFKKLYWGIHWCSIRVFRSLPPCKVLGSIRANSILWPFFATISQKIASSLFVSKLSRFVHNDLNLFELVQTRLNLSKWVEMY